MSYADTIFAHTCWKIIEEGCSSEGEHIRAKWEDGTPAHTLKTFCVVNEYDLAKEFPAQTFRRVPLKSAMDEMLWIYQKKTSDVSQLNSKVWEQWKKEDGTIGTAYGYTIGEKFMWNGKMIDQTDYVLEQLRDTPFSRRIMTNMYQYKNLAGGGLDPCCYSMTYVVTRDKDGSKVLNAVLNQRSQDMLAANGWNICQYSILLMMFAQVSGMKPGKITHVIADCHIYDRHVPIIQELIKRPTYPAPIVKLNPEVTDFYAFTTDDLIVENYETNPQIKGIEIAV